MNKISKKKILVLILTLSLMFSIPMAYGDVSFYLGVATDPIEVLTTDPSAVSGAGWYTSGSFGVVDAKQTVISGPYRYEFLEWESDDNEEYEAMTGETLIGN